ncbi:MAG: TetR/AcrR family transcriptional regulator [Chloroflexota bacterium]
MGERMVRLEATRERILESAIALYGEQGISATTLRQIGERADVAPGTLRNHFPTRESLDAAMAERLLAEAPLPELSIFDGADSIEERLARLIRVAGAFVDQAARLYRMWMREQMLSGPWREAGIAYGLRWEQLTRVALGSLADDDESKAVLQAVLQPTFFEGIRAGRRSTAEAADLITAVVTPWFAERAAGSTAGTMRR